MPSTVPTHPAATSDATIHATPHLLLAEASYACRTGAPQQTILVGLLTKGQAGAALRLRQAGGIELGAGVPEQVAAVEAGVMRQFCPGSDARRQADTRLDDLAGLEGTIGQWLARRDDEARALTGYWLMSVFLRGLDATETILMTRFLATGVATGLDSRIRKSMRRYPTGGVSEKQSLILPAFLREVADRRGWCSPFLVGRRLAHTGGTHDKLASVPGLALAPMSALRGWDGSVGPVRYYSANVDFCPRDAELYRMRGETGTVRDQGLMASSIMSKQISLPADVIILDVLHGSSAFLATRAEAERFVGLCQSVGSEFGLAIRPYLRGSDGTLGQCIGNVLEVWEAAQMLYEAGQSQTPTPEAGAGSDPELLLAADFMQMFADSLGQDGAALRAACVEALRGGLVFEAMLLLWSEHGVGQDFLERMRAGPRAALLGELQSVALAAPCAGTVTGWQAVALADLVNNRLNAYVTDAAGEIRGALLGGIEIVARHGQRVEAGQPLAIVYGEQTPSAGLCASILRLFTIEHD